MPCKKLASDGSAVLEHLLRVQRVLHDVLDEYGRVDVAQLARQVGNVVRGVQHKLDATGRLEMVQAVAIRLERLKPLHRLAGRRQLLAELLEREQHAEHQLAVLFRILRTQRILRAVPLEVVHALPLPVEYIEVVDHPAQVEEPCYFMLLPPSCAQRPAVPTTRVIEIWPTGVGANIRIPQ